MTVRSRKRRSLTRFIAPLMTMMLLGYFGFHAFNGQYGSRAHLAMQILIVDLQEKLEERTAIREKLEARVALLREGSLEKDMVDQFARQQLNLLRVDEIVLMDRQ